MTQSSATILQDYILVLGEFSPGEVPPTEVPFFGLTLTLSLTGDFTRGNSPGNSPGVIAQGKLTGGIAQWVIFRTPV